MSNKVTVILDGRRYTLGADEDTQYMYQVADFVNGQLEEVRRSNVYRSGVDCATVAAVNLADLLFKERTAAEELRRQLKQALDEVRKAESGGREQKKPSRSGQSQSAKNRKNARPKKEIPEQMPLAGEYVEGE